MRSVRNGWGAGAFAAGLIWLGAITPPVLGESPVPSAQYCPQVYINTYKWSASPGAFYGYDSDGRLYARCEYGDVPWGGGQTTAPPSGSEGSAQMFHPGAQAKDQNNMSHYVLTIYPHGRNAGLPNEVSYMSESVKGVCTKSDGTSYFGSKFQEWTTVSPVRNLPSEGTLQLDYVVADALCKD